MRCKGVRRLQFLKFSSQLFLSYRVNIHLLRFIFFFKKVEKYFFYVSHVCFEHSLVIKTYFAFRMSPKLLSCVDHSDRVTVAIGGCV